MSFFLLFQQVTRRDLITLHLMLSLKTTKKNVLVRSVNYFFKVKSFKIHNVHKRSSTVSLCNKSRVQQRKTKVMWTDNILMGVIKDCKWSMEAAAKWCPGDSFDVGILRGMPGTMLSLRGTQNGRHFPLPLSHTLSLNIPPSPALPVLSVTLEFRCSLISFAVPSSSPVSHQPIFLTA